MKHTNDFDDVFKTLKIKHIRLFISVINETFGKNFPLDAHVDILAAEGYLTESETAKGDRKLEEKITDFLIRLGGETFLLECQSYDDGSMAIRLAEYAFIAARKTATWNVGTAHIPMPSFSVVYVRRTSRTPKKTSITFSFPNGQEVVYEADNVILDDLTKEYIIEKRLFPYIPFYIARYEKDITGSGDISQAISDLEYFRNQMAALHAAGELDDMEIIDLMGFVNTVITHISDGNEAEERLVNVMGGVVMETESERLISNGIAIGEERGIAIGEERGIAIGEKRGEEKGICSFVELCQEMGLPFKDTVQKLGLKFGLPETTAKEKVLIYWNIE